MTPERIIELLDSQASLIERLGSELADANREADENAALLNQWSWIARWMDDRSHLLDQALEAWADQRDNEQGKR